MLKEHYIPGFDWVRLLGSMTVMLSHYGVFSSSSARFPQLYSMFAVVVPLFFLMSGYLSGRGFSRERVIRKALKYGSIYLFMELCFLGYTYASHYLETGAFHFFRFAAFLLKRLFRRSDYFYQLWFIPCLVYALLVNAFLDRKKRKAFLIVLAALFIANKLVGSRLDFLYDRLLDAWPLLKRGTGAQELISAKNHYLSGFLYTTLGFELVNTNIKPLQLLICVFAVCAFELTVKSLGISVILLSVLFFLLIKKLPGAFLFPYHKEISVFSVLTYFLHTTEQRLVLTYITKNIPVNIIALTLFNLLLTGAVSLLLIKRAGVHELQ